MTINIADNSARVSYSVADGVTQTSFAVPFEFFDNDDLNVYVDGTLKTITSDYTVSGGDGSTGTVTISVTGASGGSTVVITRDITLERTTDFPVSGAFNIVALNTELDRIVAIAADLDDRASRALQLTDYDVSVGLTLPVVDTRKGKTLAFNATTGAVEAGPSIADTQSVANASADIALLADIQDGTIATNAITNVNTIRTDVTTVSGISGNVTTVATNNANVTTVATNDANITTVAGSIANVNTVGNSITNVNTTATNIADVNTVAGEIGVTGVVTIVANAITDVSTVSGDIAAVITAANDLNEAVSEIDTVANAITNVDLVGTNIANVNTVAGISADVTTVAADGTDIGTVATNISNVNTVAGISANVTTVAGISANVTTVAGIGANVTTVAGDTANIGTIATNLTGTDTIGTVAGNISNVNAVAGNSTNINAVAGNATNINAVAADATDIGTVAAGIANINTVATDITNVNSVATNITGVNSFAERYRVGTSDPTTDLDAGDLFFNTTSNAYKFYDGSGWQVVNVSGIGSVLDDTTPQLGGDLDLNSNNITGTGSLNITGNISLSGTVDGRDIASDGTKLDGIEANATGDQTASEILTAIKTVDGSGSGLDADLWDGNQFSSYLNQAVLTSSSPTFSTAYIASHIYHQGDTDTYIQFVTDQINLVTGGSTELVIGSNYVRVQDASIQEDWDNITGTTPTCDVSTGGAFRLTMIGNTTFTFSGAVATWSQGFVLELEGDGSTVTWPTSVVWAGGTAPDAPASGETDLYVFWTRDGGLKWYGMRAIDAAA